MTVRERNNAEQLAARDCDNCTETRIITDELKHYQEEHERLCVLLNITREISTELQLDRLLFVIMDEVKNALHADRCSVFLLDEEKNELWSKVAHGESEIRFASHLGIAGHVATTGEILNIPDAYADSRFNPEIDRQTGYKTQNMLTFPMRNRLNEIIGAFQVLNKKEGSFTRDDEELLNAISTIAATQIENAQLYEQLQNTLNSFIETLASTIDARDPLTAGHSKRIALYSNEVAKIIHLNEPRKKVLRFAALLHDYGKVSLSDAILKNHKKLTEKQYSQMRSHPAITRAILEKIQLSKELKDLPFIAGTHHEKVDGTGYPEGLKLEQIPAEGRLLAVVDAFDAMTSNRYYTGRMSFEKVIRILEQDSGTHFDPAFVKAFKKLRLDKLVEILENESAEWLDKTDLSKLSQYTIDDLIFELRFDTTRNNGFKLVDTFKKYYQQEYLKQKERG
ncbi:GAF domain-containing protein [candidate division KSB1 bacterium]|nr:GAF domain-containing protein [candidate division KSB1 bacterium]